MIFDLSKQLLTDLSQFLSTDEKPTQGQLKVLIENALKKCKLVTREEFDAQTAVLARTRDKLEALEQKIAAMEEAANSQK